MNNENATPKNDEELECNTENAQDLTLIENTAEPSLTVTLNSTDSENGNKAPVMNNSTEQSLISDDFQIGNDLYNLYVESFSRANEETASIDVFSVIEDENDENEGLLPNTAFIDEAAENQIAFSDKYDDFEEIDDEPPELLEKESTLPPYDAKKPRKIDGRFDFAELFVFTLIAVMILTSFIFRHSIVDGGSMLNTLHSGEHLIISDVFYTPKHGDIIVCEDYSTGIRKPIVKRVIAVGGDELRITRSGEIYVNGELLIENYVFLDGEAIYPNLSMTIPDGKLFVMGDHRNASTDSRQIGVIDEDTVLGKVLLRFLPFDKFGTVD